MTHKSENSTVKRTCSNCAFYVFVKEGTEGFPRGAFHGCSRGEALPAEYYGWGVDGAVEGVTYMEGPEDVVLYVAAVPQARGLYLDDPSVALCGARARLWRQVGEEVSAFQDRRYLSRDVPTEGSLWEGRGIWSDMVAFAEMERSRLEYEANLATLTITRVGEPRGEFPEVAHVHFVTEGRPVDREEIEAALVGVDDDTCSVGGYDDKTRIGYYSVIDATPMVQVDQTFEIPLIAQLEESDLRHAYEAGVQAGESKADAFDAFWHAWWGYQRARPVAELRVPTQHSYFHGGYQQQPYSSELAKHPLDRETIYSAPPGFWCSIHGCELADPASTSCKKCEQMLAESMTPNVEHREPQSSN